MLADYVRVRGVWRKCKAGQDPIEVWWERYRIRPIYGFVVSYYQLNCVEARPGQVPTLIHQVPCLRVAYHMTRALLAVPYQDCEVVFRHELDLTV